MSLTYLHPIAAIEPHLEAHRRFLEANYEREIFLASGPKNPRDGGVIIVNGRVTRSELDDILERDPFKQLGLASYAITEFVPVKFHAALRDVL